MVKKDLKVAKKYIILSKIFFKNSTISLNPKQELVMFWDLYRIQETIENLKKQILVQSF
tara:strand:- start:807 stop:983 length:177 start_codon:yes stop_codon:yes gene_type:complete